MKTYPMHYTDNTFSYKRFGALLRLYWPGVKPGIIICAILPMVLVIIAAFFAKLTGTLLYQYIIWPISVMLSFSPMMLAWRDYKDISAQLPVTASEKFSYIIIMFWFIVPIIICMSGALGDIIGFAAFGVSVRAMSLGLLDNVLSTAGITSTSLIVFFLSFLSLTNIISNATVVAYYVASNYKNRILAGFIGYIVVSAVIGVATSFVSIFITILAINSADTVSELIPPTQFLIRILWTIVALSICVGIIYLVKLYKHLCNSGF